MKHILRRLLAALCVLGLLTASASAGEAASATA